jgi:hypothetical protein
MSDEERAAGAPTDAERARAIREQLKQIHGFDIAYEMMISLVSFGYQKLGLTDETLDLRDLGDARAAIELLRATLEVVEREYGGDRTRDVRSTLAQLQLAYAQTVQLSGAAPPAAAEPAPAPEAERPAAEPAATSAPEAEQAEPARPKRRAAAKKPAAKKPAAKKPAAGKPAAKKPAAKKPAPKKPPGGAPVG